MIRFVLVLILAGSVVLGNARLDHVSKSAQGGKAQHVPYVSHVGHTKASAHQPVRFAELGALRNHLRASATTTTTTTTPAASVSAKHTTTTVSAHTTSTQQHSSKLRTPRHAHALQTHAQVQSTIQSTLNSSSTSSSSSDSTVSLSYYVFGLMGLGSCIVGCVFGIVFSRTCLHKSDE